MQQGVGKATGLDSGQVTRMLVALAPIVMGYLGRQKRQQNLDAGGLSDMLNREASTARTAAPNDLMGMLGGLLDRGRRRQPGQRRPGRLARQTLSCHLTMANDR